MSLINTNKVEANKYELTIKVDGATFASEVEKVYMKKRNTIQVQGFRKGKAPRKMIEKMYGEGIFFEDAINNLYYGALGEAIKESKLDLVVPADVEMQENITLEDGFEFIATCITKPEVKVSNYKGLKGSKVVKTIGDDEVDVRVNSVRERQSRLVESTEGVAKNGDTVCFDFDGSVDGVHFPGGKAENFDLELGSGQFIPGFEEQMEGKKVGEEFDVNVSFPEDYHAEDLKGKAAVFACKIHSVKTKELPELDDEFAKDVSEFDTLKEYKEDLRQKMQEGADKDAEVMCQNSLFEALIDSMEADIPKEMYAARVDEMMYDFSQRIQGQGMNMDMYLQYSGMTENQFRQNFKPQARTHVKIGLALEAVAIAEGFDVSDEEFEAELAKIAGEYEREVAEIRGLIPRDSLIFDIKNNKAIEFIKENATFEEISEEEADKRAQAREEAELKEIEAEDGCTGGHEHGETCNCCGGVK